MPRPQQNNADYFSHDNDMRNHRKVKILRNTFGKQLGYCFWGVVLEYLTAMDGTEFEYADLEFEILAAEIGDVSAAEIKNMVDLALKIELLFKNDDGFIYSDSLNDRLSPVFEKRRRERDKSKTRQRRVDGKFVELNNQKNGKSTTSSGVSAAEMRQSKVKESKVVISKDIIVGLDKPTPTVVVSFESRCKGFIDQFNKLKNSKYQVTDKVRSKLRARLSNYTSKKIIEALTAALSDKFHIENNFNYITPEYILREDTLEKYLNFTPVVKEEVFAAVSTTQLIDHRTRL